MTGAVELDASDHNEPTQVQPAARRRALLVIGQLGWGGSEKQMTLLVEHLRHSHDVEVVCTSASIEPYGPMIEALGVRLHAPREDLLKGWSNALRRPLSKLRRGWWLCSTLWRKSCDVVVLYSIRNLVALAVTCLVNAPIIFTERSLGVWKSRAYLLVDRVLYRRCRLVVANSEATRRFVVSNMPSIEPRTRVVPNGIVLRPAAASSAADAAILRFSFVAGLRPWKNHQLLIDACEALARRQRSFEVVLVGDGPLRPVIEEQILAKGLTGRVVLLGWQRDPLPIIESCHVNLNLSTYESSPNAVLEGMMAGRPSIVTDVGGNTELIEHGVSGLVIASGNVDELVRAMELLIEDRELSARLGSAARRQVEEHYRIEIMQQGMTRCIREAMSRAER